MPTSVSLTLFQVGNAYFLARFDVAGCDEDQSVVVVGESHFRIRVATVVASGLESVGRENGERDVKLYQC